MNALKVGVVAAGSRGEGKKQQELKRSLIPNCIWPSFRLFIIEIRSAVVARQRGVGAFVIRVSHKVCKLYPGKTAGGWSETTMTKSQNH